MLAIGIGWLLGYAREVKHYRVLSVVVTKITRPEDSGITVSKGVIKYMEVVKNHRLCASNARHSL